MSDPAAASRAAFAFLDHGRWADARFRAFYLLTRCLWWVGDWFVALGNFAMDCAEMRVDAIGSLREHHERVVNGHA